jgi:predicted nucleic acid-binding protein
MAHKPSLWPLEFSNVLKAVSLKRITEARAHEIMAQNKRWTILLDNATPDPADIQSFSLAYVLTSYDSAYLNLAMRLRLSVTAEDGTLRDVAKAVGLGWVGQGKP